MCLFLLDSVIMVNIEASSRRGGAAMLKFEELESSDPAVDFHIVRARIPGGWLVYITHPTCSEAGCCFVPDLQHEWEDRRCPRSRKPKQSRAYNWLVPDFKPEKFFKLLA